jgi:hypothetical protein
LTRQIREQLVWLALYGSDNRTDRLAASLIHQIFEGSLFYSPLALNRCIYRHSANPATTLSGLLVCLFARKSKGNSITSGSLLNWSENSFEVTGYSCFLNGSDKRSAKDDHAE